MATHTSSSHWDPVWVATSRKPPRWKRGWQWHAEVKQKVSKKRSIGDRAADWAESQVGYHENPPGSNMNKYGAKAGENGVPWCSIFAMTAWDEGGAQHVYEQIIRLDYVPQVHIDSVDRLFGMGPVKNLKRLRRGDLVGLWGDRHIEMFIGWADKAKTKMITVGGNTGGKNPANGGEVGKQERALADASFGARIYV